MSISTLDRFHKRPVERKNWLAMASSRSMVLISYPLSDWSAARWWFSAQRVSWPCQDGPRKCVSAEAAWVCMHWTEQCKCLCTNAICWWSGDFRLRWMPYVWKHHFSMTARVSLGYFRLERLIQVILTVLQLGFTETFEHIGPLLTLYIVLLCVSMCVTKGFGTQKSPTGLLYWNSLCFKVS